MEPRLVMLVGYLGYWGPNLKRNLEASDKYVIGALVDQAGPCKTIDDGHRECLANHGVPPDVCIIATPPSTHFGLAWHALEKGMHVLVEKPLTTDWEQAQKLVEYSEELGQCLGVDHTFLFSDHVRVIKDIVDSGEIGELLRITSRRHNLGKFQDSGVVWDLAPHDLAIAMYITGDMEPQVLHIDKYAHLEHGISDTAIISGVFGTATYMLDCSWLQPLKDRTMTLVGTDGMIVYDMMSPEPLVVYDKRAERREKEWVHSFTYKKVHTLEPREPLRLLVDEFADCCYQGTQFISPGQLGTAVVKAIQQLESQDAH